MPDPWLPTLITPGPQEGFELALRISRATVKAIQPSEEIRRSLRNAYADDPEQLIASQVVAIDFAAIAKANEYRRS